MTDIAIVGMSGRFPGASDVDALWELVRDGREGLTDLDDASLLAAGVSRETLSDPYYVKRAGLLADVDCFDAELFGIGAAEAAIMDPQHRILLECAWAALEMSGHVPASFPGAIGVFAGCGPNTYLMNNLLTRPDVVERMGWFLLRHTSNDKDFLPTGISYRLDLRGPSVAVQTACSTSLVAVHMAAQSLLSLECDIALAGGVTVDVPHGVGYRYAEGEVADPEGRCRPFDVKSGGTVLTSGGAMVALRRLADAEADGDPVLAVIKGSAINNDGTRKVGYLAPSVDGHADVAKEALAVADVNPATVTLLEAHGTGTAMGDPIEVAALTEAYQTPDRQGWCRLNSTKANIGHCDTAAGIASLITAVQALRHRWLPPLAGFTAPNPLLDLDSSPFHLSPTGNSWPAGPAPRRAAVSNLGIGGTNAHVVLEEAPARDTDTGADSAGPSLQLLSAASAPVADTAAAQLAAHLAERTPGQQADAAHTLLTGRRRLRHRRALVAGSELPPAADQAGESPPRVVFCFPGGGSQYRGMAAGLLAADSRFDTFRSAFAEVAAALADNGGPDVARFVDPGTDPDVLRRVTISLPTVLAVEVALARQLLAWGITPDAMVGHSLGEYTAAHLAGVLDLDGLAKLVVCRSELVERASGEGCAMAVVTLPERQLLPHLGSELSLAGVNAPDECTVSGRIHAVDDLERRLRDTDAAVHKLVLAAAGHSSLLDPVLEEFAATVAQVRSRPPAQGYITSVTGRWITPEDLADPRWWVRHLRGTVRFGDGLATALADGPAVVLEVGPGHGLSSYAQRADAAPLAAVPMLRHHKESTPDAVHLLAAMGRLWTTGVEADWASIITTPGPRRTALLPNYPFARTRHWIGTPPRAPEGGPRPLEDWASAPAWEPVGPLSVTTTPGAWAVVGPDDDPVRAAVRDELARRNLSLTDDAAQATSVAVVAPDACGYDLGTFERALDGARTVAAAGGGRFGVITRGVWSDGHASSALALGPALVLVAEAPGTIGVAVDLTGPAGDADLRCAVDALLAGPAGVLSVRAGELCRRVLRPVPFGSPGSAPVTPGGTWLVTGGLGGVGSAMALRLAAEHGCSLVLTAGSPLPDDPQAAARRLGPGHPVARRLRRLARLRECGVHVRVEPADLTDPAAVTGLLDRLASDGVALDGVVHAAGALADRPLELLTMDDVDRACRAKAGGALALVGELAERGIPNLVLVSSTSTHLCPAGQAAYVGANSVLDALAGRHGDLRVTTVGWGVWAGDGMAAEAADRLIANDGAGPVSDWATVSHPVLHEVGTGAAGSVLALGTLSADRWVVDEHRLLDGTAILPGTALLGLPLAALAAAGEPRATLAGAVLLAPLAVPEAGEVPVRVVIESLTEGRPRAVRVDSRRPGAGWVTHLEAEVDPQLMSPSAPPAGATPELVADPMAGQLRHVRLGTHWDGLARAHRGREEAVADVPAPDTDEAWSLHPATADLGIALGVALLDGNGLWVPAAVESVVPTSTEPGGHVRLHARRRPAGRDPNEAVIDVAVGGTLCLRGLTMRRLASGAELRTSVPEPAVPDLPPILALACAGGITAEKGGEALDRVLAGGIPHVVVSSVPLEALTEVGPAKAACGRAEEVVAGSTAATIIAAWEDMLGISVGPDDDFFQLGGNSLHAVRIVNRLKRQLGAQLGIDAFMRTPTPAALAAVIDEMLGNTPGAPAAEPATASSGPRCLVPIKPTGERTPLFMMHGAGGNVLNFSPLARQLPADRPLYGLQAHGCDGRDEPDPTIEAMAARYVEAIRTVQPVGPYLLGGYSGGGIVALEMAERLRACGEHTAVVIMFDTFKPVVAEPPVRTKLRNLARNTRAQGLALTATWLKAALRRRVLGPPPRDEELAGVDLTEAFMEAVRHYELGSYDVAAVLLQATLFRPSFVPDYTWEPHVTGDYAVRVVAGDHDTQFAPEFSGALAEHVTQILERAGA